VLEVVVVGEPQVVVVGAGVAVAAVVEVVASVPGNSIHDDLFSFSTAADVAVLSSLDNSLTLEQRWDLRDQILHNNNKHSVYLLHSCLMNRNPQDLNPQKVPQYFLHHHLFPWIQRREWRRKT